MTGLWLASYVALWLLVIGLAIAVVALLRQIGVLHARIAPMGTHFAGEGPEVDAPAPNVDIDFASAGMHALIFTSQTCALCKELLPSVHAIRRQYREVRVHTVELETERHVFDAFHVRSTPYAVMVDRNGVVRGRGIANTLEQLEELLRESLLAPADPTQAGAMLTIGPKP